jgi:RNA recognition motif-containing protein
MSYNYEEIVQSIRKTRRVAYDDVTSSAPPDLDALQKSMEGFTTLSKHCPMTPLLWMQYAHDTEVLMENLIIMESAELNTPDDEARRLTQMQAKQGALLSSTGILELALVEFSGCALLQLYYLETLADCLVESEELRLYNKNCGVVGMEILDQKATWTKLSTAFEYALNCVGRGTHVNEGMIISDIYRLNSWFILFLLSCSVEKFHDHGCGIGDGYTQQISGLFQDWSKTPMGEGSNDEMMEDMEYIWDEHSSLIASLYCYDNGELIGKLNQQKAKLWVDIDDARKITSSLTNILSSYENEIDIAMSNEGILLPRQSIFIQSNEQSISYCDKDIHGKLETKYLPSLRRSSLKWNHILLGDTNTFLLGMGGVETSRAFMRGASFLQRIYQDTMKTGKTGKSVNITERSMIEEHVATNKDAIIRSFFERATSECPTVESVWISYMNFLRAEWTLYRKNDVVSIDRGDELSNTLRSVSHRAVRNCPYSCTLFEIRMTTLGLISQKREPDDITAVMKEATDLGFLNNNRETLLHLRLVAILVVTRWLFSLVSMNTTVLLTSTSTRRKDYDEDEDISIVTLGNRKNSTSSTVTYDSLNPTTMEEAQDLIDDIRDMYDETDAYLFKSHVTWTEGRVVFWKHRALTEAYTLCPIAMALKAGEDDDAVFADKNALQYFEKLVKAEKPSHPDSWREYIRYASVAPIYLVGSVSNDAKSIPDSAAAAVCTLRRTRGLYNRAISCVKKAGREITSSVESKQTWMGKGIDGTMFRRDCDAALLDLCREYLAFERQSGSEESFVQAQTLVRSKLVNWDPAATTIAPVLNIQEESHGKRKLDADESNGRPDDTSSKVTVNDDENEEGEFNKGSKRVKVKTDLKQPKKTDGVHKVRIGKLDYPAHPYTIYISNLSKDTQDMDLVDAFVAEFGAVVHGRILREKKTGKGGHHFHGESKCAGLIQFEDRSSVENALRMDGQFEVAGRPVKIQRSHLPAVGLVPQGMHRVNPKGEGKASKRNQVKKKSNDDGMDVEEKGKGEDQYNDKQTIKSTSTTTSPSSLSLSVLSFKPRGMRQKPKISLVSTKK